MNPLPRKRSVLILISYYVPAFRGGGPIRTVEGLVEEHQDKYDFYIFCSNHDHGQKTPLPLRASSWIDRGPARVFYADTSTRRSFLRDLATLRTMRFDFVYLNSFFSFGFSILPALLMKFGLIRAERKLIAPRGQFGRSALGISPRKKRLFLKASALTRMHSGMVWHGSSEQESREIRTLFPNAQVVVRQNETNLPLTADIGNWSPPGAGTRFVYVGRLSPKKRIELALHALAKASPSCSFDIYGEFEDPAYEEIVVTCAESLPKESVVRFHGALPHDQVRAIFTTADFFLFPTSHENFGHVVAESMSVGCPLIVEDVTPFSDLVSDGMGIIVNDSTVDSWAKAINAAVTKSAAELRLSRSATALSFDRWRNRSRQASVFELLEDIDKPSPRP